MDAVAAAVNGLREEVREARIALERIASLLEIAIQPAAADPVGGCDHPIDQRLAIGSGGQPGFVCEACKATVINEVARG